VVRNEEMHGFLRTMFQAKNFSLALLALCVTELSANCAEPQTGKSASAPRLQVTDTSAWHFVEIGWKAFNHGKINEAVNYANVALERDPHYAPALILRGSARSELEQNNYALRDLEQGIAMDPKQASPMGYQSCGKVYWKLKQYNKALAAATKAINLDPKKTIFYRDRAGMYMSLNDDKKALIDLNSSIKLNPSERDSYLQRATIYRKTKQYQLAIPDATKVVEISEKSKALDRYWAQALSVRADSYDGIGRKDLANTDRAKVNAVGKDWIEDVMGQ
jgi:tetratricopeptide (TPR) repeat protein